MKLIYFLIFFIMFFNGQSFSKDIYESDFFKINLVTNNASETKKNSVDEIKYKSLFNIIDKILDNHSKKKFNRLIKEKINIDNLIQNIIIENEIITEKKYIANIKVNFDKKKIINILRDNKINYTDIKSENFLIISTYNIDFIKIGLDKNESFNNHFENFVKNDDTLISYFFPYLDTNDRYILPYKKIIDKNIQSYKKILKKYNLNNLIYINIHEDNLKKIYVISLNKFNNNKFYNIGEFNFQFNTEEDRSQLFKKLSNKISNFLLDWWKKEYEINHNKYKIIKCDIISKDYMDLIKIKSKINEFNQIKNINTKKIELNKNTIEFNYYGDFKVLLKNLNNSNILFNKNNNKCTLNSY